MSATGTQVVSRLRSATPLQVTLKVRIAEINRTLLKKMGVNLLSRDSTRRVPVRHRPRRSGRLSPGSPSGQASNISRSGGRRSALPAISSASICSARSISLQNDGLVSTLAEPNLTALSGETASFLAGGEFPIPVSQAH